jgi:hypothetical protein
MSRDFEMKVDFDDVIAMFDGLSDAAKELAVAPCRAGWRSSVL